MRSTLLLAALLAAAPVAQEGYRLPPPEVVDLVDAPPSPDFRPSPDAAWALVVERSSLPTIADLSRPMLRLAGMRIDPQANARYRTSFDRGLLLRDLRGTSEERVPLPEGARLSGTSWSHTSGHFAFTAVTDAGTELWVGSVEEPTKPQRITPRLNAVLTGGFRWTSSGTGLYYFAVPEGRGEPPERAAVPTGPRVQETTGESTPLRTYQDLLSDEHDAALFEHYATAELRVRELAADSSHAVGQPALYAGASPSPDGQHLLVTRIERPFSYLMPSSLFPRRVDVMDTSGRVQHTVAEVPLGEGIPLHGVRTGPRSVSWKSGEAATLVWFEALDGGDPKVEAEHRDRVLSLRAPFDGEPGEMLKTKHRARSVTWTEDPNRCLVSEYDRDRRWTTTWLVDLRVDGGPPQAIEDRSVRDRYGDPGRLFTRQDATGHRLLHQDGPWVYRAGTGDSPDGARPFLDRFNLDTLSSQRMWRSSPGSYESAVALVKSGPNRWPSFITRYESPTEPPNWRLRDLEVRDGVRALTDHADPTPQLRGIQKRLVTYERGDGVQLSATLYLPADYEEGTRLPLLVWAYPREFNDPKTAGQVSGSPYRFTRFGGSSHLYLLTQGYAIMDGATMPVIGDAETMNDTFIEQIVAAAKAAIDEAARLGVADPDRVGVGGHSYGAFMTANLLAHCDLFRAGIARSGAYNRTLTPFGFQSERRTVWESPETYFAISPFMHADHIDEPMLMIHGAVDNNSGTFPMQSERMYQAIKGNGGTARLVMLPNESHGYRARESVLHTLAEMTEWFERYVKGARLVEASFHDGLDDR